MAITERQTAYGTLTTLLTSGLDSLANNARAISAAQGADAPAAGSEALSLADFELVVTYNTAPTANTAVDLYLVRSADGTNYEDGSTTLTPATNAYAGSFALDAVNTAQRKVIRDVPLPPGLWKALVVNNATGQAMAATGNSLKYRPHSFEGL